MLNEEDNQTPFLHHQTVRRGTSESFLYQKGTGLREGGTVYFHVLTSVVH
ncbi:hypothetical protein Leryth_012811 [Lithospermum erythrorhizon]|nr:hypothetical protein Leryth_012811 [Lithospermum erythrorhizon]